MRFGAWVAAYISSVCCARCAFGTTCCFLFVSSLNPQNCCHWGYQWLCDSRTAIRYQPLTDPRSAVWAAWWEASGLFFSSSASAPRSSFFQVYFNLSPLPPQHTHTYAQTSTGIDRNVLFFNTLKFYCLNHKALQGVQSLICGLITNHST